MRAISKILQRASKMPVSNRHQLALVMLNGVSIAPIIGALKYHTPTPIPPNVVIHLDNFAFQTKNLAPPQIRALFKEFRYRNLTNSIVLATDGSKQLDRTSVGIYSSKGYTVSGRIPSQTSVFTAEGLAIFLALKHCVTSYEHYTLLTDSHSILQSLSKGTRKSPRISLLLLDQIAKSSQIAKSLSFIWVPSHTGITENEQADQLAKQALNQDFISHLSSPQDLCQMFLRDELNKEHREWKECKYFQPFPHLDEPQGYRPLIKSRKLDVLIARLRTKTLPTNAILHKCKLVESPKCPNCGHIDTNEHYLLDCSFYQNARKDLYQSLSLQSPAFTDLVNLSLNSRTKIQSLLKFFQATNRF
ncbi:uncharacterized protein [Parasteatoda tepidariorum]|uniref:uncharacterized protein n=1 Tax=Parasteatoda tepidariorum TaxID=114398 RepID=UPI0039BCD98B